MRELWSLGAVEAAQAIRGGAITATALAESLLARIERFDGELAAFATVARERVLAQARACDAGSRTGDWRGPLHGVPIAVKDNFDTAGQATSAGSRLLAERIPTTDATAVARLQAAGAIVLGKTAMTVFAAMDPAPTRNPWQHEHTPGGSSSGSAAAVAALLAPAAIGSQTAGSILRPAAYCGVVGLKPTYGAVACDGLYPCAWSMDHAGPLARSVDDVALLYSVLAERVARRRDTVQDLRVGIAQDLFREASTAQALAAVDRAAHALTDAGARVAPCALPASFAAGMQAGILVMYAEMAVVHADRFPRDRDRYGWRLAVLLDAGRSIASTDYLRAQQVRRHAARDLDALFDALDVLVTPSTPAGAPAGRDATGDWRFNLPFSAFGHPALTVPTALDADGLPLGVQLVARRGAEDVLFAAGKAIEARVGFPSSPYRTRH